MPMVRPSPSSTQKLSASKVTFLGETFMPGCLQFCTGGCRDRHHLTQCLGVETIIAGQPYFWRQPRFGFHARFENMDMGWFQRVAFIRVEEELEAIISKNCRHEALLVSTQ